MNQSEKYLGVLTQLEERQPEKGKSFFIGKIESPQISKKVSFHQKSLNQTEMNDLKEGVLILFEIKTSTINDKKDSSKTFERLDAINCTLNCETYILDNYEKFETNLVLFVNKHASNRLKQKLNIVENNEQMNQLSVESKKTELIEKTIKILPKSFLETIFATNTSEYNQNLFNILVDGLKIIDTEDVFQQAKFLLKFNTTTSNCIENLNSIFYHKATNEYKFRLWFEKLTDYCSTEILKYHFEKAELEFKKEIIARCQGNENGFLVLNNQIKNSNEVEEVYFSRISSIREKLLQELNEAKKTIFVAVAWFTNDELFNKLCMKLEQGVKVELIIINDYINNWEGGLPFQIFINLGGKLYLSEYPSIMHHKFCIIDNETIFNGSYNWTYYAEVRNDENIMMFKGKPNLVRKFQDEFDNLKSKLNLIDKVVSFDSSQIVKFERFAFRQYFSTDLTLRAEKRKDKNIIQVSNILSVAIELDEKNIKAQSLQKEIQSKVELEQNINLVGNILSEKIGTDINKSDEVNKNQNFFENIEEKDKDKTSENNITLILEDENVKIDNKPTVNAQQAPKQETQKSIITQKEVKQETISNFTITQTLTTPKDYSSITQQEPVKKQFQNLKVAIALDISSSMKSRYNNGTMQQVIEKTLALAIKLSTDETLSVWVFDTVEYSLKPIKQSDFSEYVSREILSKYKMAGGTETFCVLKAINNHFVNQNTFVIILTDGEDSKENEMRQIIQQSLNKPIFWQFIGIGNKFSKLEALDKANKNVSFFSLNDISTISNNDLYNKLLAEFPTWYKESETKGLIK